MGSGGLKEPTMYYMRVHISPWEGGNFSGRPIVKYRDFRLKLFKMAESIKMPVGMLSSVDPTMY